MGAEAGWDEKDVVDCSLEKRADFIVSGFFEHTLSTAAVFISCAIFVFNFQHAPETLGLNLLYLDFSVSEIGVRSAFRRFTFFLIPLPSRFLNLVLG